MVSEQNGSPSNIANEQVCIKTSVTQISTSVKLAFPSKYQAAYDKSSFPRSIFNKGVGKFLENELKNGDFRNNVRRTLIVPKSRKNEVNISMQLNKQQEARKDSAAYAKRGSANKDHLNYPKLPGSITDKLYKV